MDNNKNKKIEDILGSLDTNQRAPAPDFFYTRLKARMEGKYEKETTKKWLLRPAYALAALLLVLAINVVVILKGEESSGNNSSDTETVQSIAAEYSLNNSLTYEINDEK